MCNSSVRRNQASVHDLMPYECPGIVRRKTHIGRTWKNAGLRFVRVHYVFLLHGTMQRPMKQMHWEPNSPLLRNLLVEMIRIWCLLELVQNSCSDPCAINRKRNNFCGTLPGRTCNVIRWWLPLAVVPWRKEQCTSKVVCPRCTLCLLVR